ncbi:MAG: DUF1127 domain-containing protein [Rhodospirillaceae bacterium]|jgi:uncharacterized protein YjiS (DUF1127 family)|nr:DUF1127 domain-containing protein [Rhodospirillaceae bacterium]MBT4687742.1 DUF1127 domain-containing protein [Rhodospirillaceae bacterium]MBT5082834.1 DUF1127 domain-containing protein [Rhodospirillaceae bacterium]MBT5524278.1 DUF1127 domain-containing protein [Rhodospirillaceae bacterium]MBT5878928.1 DUF1127 domain-containing protein [Rhodospirillaceae bacterium]
MMSISKSWGSIGLNLNSLRHFFSYRAAFATLSLWSERLRQRRDLATLDDFMLRDLGLSRRDVKWESSKPFWWR